MISQGSKGYCYAATLARVLNYYGYDVDMHALAELANTDYDGTSHEDGLASMRRVCNDTPFEMQQIDQYDIKALHDSIDSGFPIIWFIPGHARLLIGYNPDSGDFVYSDSWGAGHEFKTMSINKYHNLTRKTFILNAKH